MMDGGVAERVDVRSARTPRVALGLILAVLIAYGGAIRNGFLYDDYHLIVENPAVLSHAWGAVWTSPDAASRDAAGRGFRPATLSSYVIDHILSGGRAPVYHATQVALHAAAMWCVFLIATGVGLAPRWAAAAALVMGLHPVQTEAVHYLSARSSVLSTLGLLVSFWSYLRWRTDPQGRLGWLAASLGFLALAVLSKESAVVGLVWLLAYERLVASASWEESARRLSLHVVTAGVSAAPAILVFGVHASGAPVSTDTALATGVVVLGRHLWSWIAPLGLDPVSPQPWVGWDQPGVWSAAALTATACCGGYALRARLPLVAWGIAGGVSALLPVLALPVVTNVALVQSHRGYQAAVGLSVATAALAEALVRRVGPVKPVGRVVGLSLGAAMVIAAIIIDARAGRLWRDEVGFWTAAVTRYPSEAAYHHSLGAARLRAGDPLGAVEAFMSAARWDPLLPRVDFNLGLVYTKLGRDAEAIAAYERAVTRDSTDVKSLANLGALYERVGDPDRAVRAYGKALAVDPNLVPIQHRLARLSKVPQTGVGGLGHPVAGQ